VHCEITLKVYFLLQGRLSEFDVFIRLCDYKAFFLSLGSVASSGTNFDIKYEKKYDFHPATTSYQQSSNQASDQP